MIPSLPRRTARHTAGHHQLAAVRFCPWTAPLDGACYQLCCAGAQHYPELLAMLAEDGETATGYAPVGTLCVAEQAEALDGLAALLRSPEAGAPGPGEVTRLGPGEPARMFPPLAPGLAGLWISAGARIDGRPGRPRCDQGGSRFPVSDHGGWSS